MENTKHHRLTSFAETASEAPLQEPDRQYYFIEKANSISTMFGSLSTNG